MNSCSRQQTVRILALLLLTFLAACDTAPKLRAADKYAASLKTSVEALESLVDDHANAARIGSATMSVSPLTEATSKYSTTFKVLACASYSESLTSVTLGLGELLSYQAYVAAAAADPKDSSLGGAVVNIQKVGKLSFEKPDEVEVSTAITRRKAACDAEVEALLGSPVTTGRPLGALLSVWPSIKSLLEFGAGEVDRQARLVALKKLMESPENAKRFRDALSTIEQSGPLRDSVQLRRKEALWLAFSFYVRSQQQLGADAFVQRHKSATQMNAALEAYQRYADIDIKAMLEKIGKANDAFRDATLNNDVSIGSLVSVLDFLSGFADKLSDAKTKLKEARE